MRLSEEKIKQAILHPEAGIRERAVRYFARSHSEDQSIMPLVIKAVETYGKQDAYNLIGLSTALTQTAGTISWIVDELNGEESGSDEDYAFNLTRVLCDADPRPRAASPLYLRNRVSWSRQTGPLQGKNDMQQSKNSLTGQY
jgi:hypothetical protein